MDFLQSFSLRDLLIFSSESYFKLFELANLELWPYHIPLALLAVAAVFFLYKRQRHAPPFILVWLGFIWAFVGFGYFGVYYSQISTYAHYISYAFWAEACLLLFYALFANHKSITSSKASPNKWRLLLGGGLIYYGFILHPVVSLFMWDQPFNRFELFSVAPDPTAIASLGFILLIPVRGYLLLTVIPMLWLLLSVMTYQAF